MKKILFGILIGFLSLLILGCSKEGVVDLDNTPGAELIQQKLLEANSNIRSYTANIKVDMFMGITTEGELSDTTMNVTSTVDSVAKADVENKRMEMKGTVRANAMGFRTETDLETYIVDGYSYNKVMGTWTKTEADENYWSQQDKISESIELIKSGEIELLGEETLNGVQYYKVEIRPNLQELVRMTMEKYQMNEMYDDSLDFGDMLKEFSSILWINKDTFVIEKTVTSMRMVMTPENMGGQAADLDFGSMDMIINTENIMHGINEPVEIGLPSGAEKAAEISADMAASGPLTGAVVG